MFAQIISVKINRYGYYYVVYYTLFIIRLLLYGYYTLF